jgi:N4-gp56 family major capsid protein
VQAGDNINGTELRKLRRTMRKNLAQPINGFYQAIVSPETMFDLQAMTEWSNVGQYQEGRNLERGIVMRMWGFEFHESERAKVFTGAGAGSIDVHATVALGQNAFGSVDISGHSLETIIHPVNSGGSADPLNQRQTVGWKAMYVAVRLNESFLARLEHAVTS